MSQSSAPRGCNGPDGSPLTCPAWGLRRFIQPQVALSYRCYPHSNISVLACYLAFALWSLHKLCCYYHSLLLIPLSDQTVPWHWELYSSSAVAALSSSFLFSFGDLLLLAGTQWPLFLSKSISLRSETPESLQHITQTAGHGAAQIYHSLWAYSVTRFAFSILHSSITSATPF